MRLAASRRTAVVCVLGTAQTIAWAASFYIPAVLAVPAAADLGISPAWVFGGFSLALVMAAAIGPRAGTLVDRHGGRGVLATSSLVFAVGLALFSLAAGPLTVLLSWAVIGIGMGIGLYETAFATLARIYGPAARSPITGITLIAGFASTVGWPISGVLEASFGWREACLCWAVAHLLLCLPLNLALPRAEAKAPDPQAAEATGRAAERLPPGFWILAAVFASFAFTGTAMAAHLPRLLEASGASPAAAIAAGALIGPAQVAARMMEFLLFRGVHPLRPARLAALAHPAGAAIMLVLGGPGAAVFAVVHGAGNGMMTIARGTVPLVLFGAEGYGYRSGLLAAPARISQAVAPLAFGFAVSAMGTGPFLGQRGDRPGGLPGARRAVAATRAVCRGMIRGSYPAAWRGVASGMRCSYTDGRRPAPNRGGPEENARCPRTQPKRPRACPLRR